MRVFISYSRAQFYLAEDLALALGSRGVDVWFDTHRLEPGQDWRAGIDAGLRGSEHVVLVASREASTSEFVQSELKIAAELGQPVIVASADGSRGVTGAACVDMRRGFEANVDGLIGALHGEPATPSRGGPPAALLAAAVTLVLIALGCLSIVSIGIQRSTPYGTINRLGIVMLTLFAVFCVWLAVDLVKHRPRRFTPARATLVIGWLVCVGTTRFWITGAYGALPLAGALALALGPPSTLLWMSRSPALYRWLPTGDAPRRMRRRRLRRRGIRDRGDTSGIGTITYAIHADELDAPVAATLDAALRRRGNRPEASDLAARQLCVVSNLTDLDWLQNTLAVASGRVILVIVSPIPASILKDATRYQWVDHRRRRRGTLDRLAKTIGGSSHDLDAELVPERLSSWVLPLGVMVIAADFVFRVLENFIVALATLVGTGTLDTALGPARWTSLAVVYVLVDVAGLVAIGVLTITRRLTLRWLVGLTLGARAWDTAMTLALYPGSHHWSAFTPLLALDVVGLLVTWRILRLWLPPRLVVRGVRRVGGEEGSWRERVTSRRLVFTGVAAAAVLALTTWAPDRTLDKALADGPGFSWTPPPGWVDSRGESAVEERRTRVVTKGNLGVGVQYDPIAVLPDEALEHHLEWLRTTERSQVTSVDALDFQGERHAVLITARSPHDNILEVFAVRRSIVYLVTIWHADGTRPSLAELEDVLDNWRWTQP